MRRGIDPADLEVEHPLRRPHSDSVATDTVFDIAESDLIKWLISLVRSGDPITRLAAGGVLTNLLLAGLVAKRLVMYVALLIIPVMVRLLDEGAKVVAVGSTGVGGIDAQTWGRWTVEERAPAVLSRLVMDSMEFQKAAIEADALPKLAAILKRVSELPSSAANGVNGSAAHAAASASPAPASAAAAAAEEPRAKNNPEYNHRMKVKVGVLRCIANLGLVKDEYRRKIIEANILMTVVSTCLKPLTPVDAPLPLGDALSNARAEGNPPPVLIAACGVIRSVSRSVSILRTSLIDAAVAIPMFSLLRHGNDGVKIAATAAVCNLVLDFSPMRKPIAEAGALDVLCELAKGNNRLLRLEALWSIKHLVLEADTATKKRSLENLGAEYVLSVIANASTTNPYMDSVMDEGDDDEEMADDPAVDVFRHQPTTPSSPSPSSSSSSLEQRLPPRMRKVVRQLQKKERTALVAHSRKEAIALQEQGLEYIRNLICGNEVGTMIDLVFSFLGAEHLFSLYENLLSTPNQPGEIIHAVVYNIVHIAAGVPKHRQRVIERKQLLRMLLDFWNHQNPRVRSGLAWVVINLTWREDGAEAAGVQMRIDVLRSLGWAERLKEMEKDTELDVKERVKTAEYQLLGAAGGSGNGSTAAGGSGSSSSGR